MEQLQQPTRFMEDNMKIEVKEINEIPRPILVDESGTRKLVLEDFLFDARTSIDDYLKEISKAENDYPQPTGFTSNQVDSSFFSDRAEIEHLWCEDDNGELLFVEMPLQEVKQLLFDWKQALGEWYSKNRF